MSDAILPLPFPIPDNEADRLAALYRYCILDTPAEVEFDRITALASRLFDVPIALVSLLDQSRAWFKSSHGFEMRQVERDATICSFAVLFDDVFVIPDTRQDDRFVCNPFVQSEPGVRFYAGAPLITPDGFNLGTLCLLDSKPRPGLTPEQQSTLADLAAMVMDELELKLALNQISRIDAALFDITRSVATVTGEAFFRALVEQFTRAMDVEYAYIGIPVEAGTRIQTIAACAHGELIENFSYSLQDTPCLEVILQRKLCCHPQAIQGQFPQAPLLGALAIESYMGIPVLDSTGSFKGILGIMGCKPLINIQLAESLLTVFSLRVAAELERQAIAAETLRLYEAEQHARIQAEAANRLKDEFLAVLSHELRSPLNPILGWTKLLQTQQLDSAKTTKALQTIERNAKLQSQLIDDLLDISRIMRGKLTLTKRPVNLSEVILSALETVRLAAEAKAIQVIVNLESNIGSICGETARLQQVIWNLLSNAVKFTPNGGRIEVRLEQVGRVGSIGEMGRWGDGEMGRWGDGEVGRWGGGEMGRWGDGEVGSKGAGEQGSSQLENPLTPSSPHPLIPSSPHPLIPSSPHPLIPSPPLYAQITVTDNGKGIDPHFLPHVFDYFRQEDGSTTRQFGGLGLGLAIARQLVELHGGTIHAASSGEGQGATFTVCLPVQQTAGNQAQPDLPDTQPQTDVPLNNVRLLVVDDNDETRDFLLFLLSSHGAIVTAAASAYDALAAVEQAEFDLIISDIAMPEVDGYMLMRKLRQQEQRKLARLTPAIALTAYAGESNRQAALQAGFQGHLAKPIDPDAMIRAIVNLLASHSQGYPSDAALSNTALSDIALSDAALSDTALSDAALSDTVLSDATKYP